MTVQGNHILRWMVLVLCSLLLASFISACGIGGTGTSTSTPAAAPTSAPTTAGTPGAMATLTGNGFTMNYPQNWQINRSGSNLVILQDNTGTMRMSITVVPNPRGAISVDQLSNTGVKAQTAALKDAQTVTTLPATVSIGGSNWVQKSVSGVARLNNRNTEMQGVVLANVHEGKIPAGTKGYTIEYRIPKAIFDQTNTNTIQPMLQSFKFV